ncbi:MAG: EamA family transporter [Acidimicrobiia bacterium]|nr:EamA family transporter [Acidimicrobiia bacterium]
MLTATLLALVAAALHASWNLLMKTSDDRELAAWGQFLAGGIIFLPVLVVAGVPDRAAWPYLVASGLIHVLYVEGLVRAYHHGDFSLAYPLSRGGGALTAAVGGAILLDDTLRVPSWIALGIVAVGLGSLVQRGATRASLGWAALTAVVIGSYTLVDTAGARRTSNGFAYGVALTICAAIALSAVGMARGRGADLVATLRRSWWRYLASGLCLTGAYSLVLVAVRFAPVGYVATLRESSVVLGAYAGWALLGERLALRRLASALVVTAGLVALVATR